jgi:hypothetical protein
MKPAIRITVTLSPREAWEVVAAAYRRGVTRSMFVKQAVLAAAEATPSVEDSR